MTVFLVVAGSLLLGFGAIFMVSNIVPTSWDVSWAEQKDAFRRTVRRPWFRIGLICFLLGFLMLFVPIATAFNW